VNDMAIKNSCNVETYDYESDFKFLTLKEKRKILKNAKYLLKLQKGKNVFLACKCPVLQKEKCSSDL